MIPAWGWIQNTACLPLPSCDEFFHTQLDLSTHILGSDTQHIIIPPARFAASPWHSTLLVEQALACTRCAHSRFDNTSHSMILHSIRYGLGGVGSHSGMLASVDVYSWYVIVVEHGLMHVFFWSKRPSVSRAAILVNTGDTLPFGYPTSTWAKNSLANIPRRRPMC